MSVRSVSARLCRQCRRTEAQLSHQRRLASTAVNPGVAEHDEEVQPRRQDERQQEASTSASALASTSTPIASTSRANAEVASILSSLRFEINQAQPIAQTVWTRLHELYELSPSTLVREDDLLRDTIPILSKHTPPPASARGLSKIIAVQEQAEAIYARYRFISNRMKESGEIKRLTVQENNEITLTWMRSIEALGYGPAAWRIWKDHRDYIATNVQEDGKLHKTTKHIAHSVLIATMKWLVLQRDRNVATANFTAHADSCLQTTNEIITFLHENNMYNWIARSLRVRILKEAEKKKEMLALLKEEFQFDPSFPSLVPFDVNTGVASLPSAKKMDPHVINTVLYQLAKENELSKMISLFETAIGTSPVSSKPLNQSMDVPFFSSSSIFAQGQAADLEATQEGVTQEDQAPSKSTFAQRLQSSADPSSSSSDYKPPTLLTSAFLKPVELSNINMRSLELLVSEAVRLDRIYLAHHYVKQAHAIWRQERTRLRKALENLSGWSGKASDMSQEDLMSLVPPKIIGPRVSISTRALYPIYMQLKHSKNGTQRYAPVLASCMRIAKQTVDLLEDDTAFYARAYDNLARIKEALTPESVAMLEEKRRERDGFETFDPNFDLTKHLLLQTRLKVELGELARYIEIAVMDPLAARQADALLNELSTQKAPQVNSRTEALTILINRLQKGIHKAENWLLEDAAKDSNRIKLLRSTLHLSSNQLHARVKRKMSKFARRRAIIIEAVTVARMAEKEAIAERREIQEAEEAAVKAREDAENEVAPSRSTSEVESTGREIHSGELHLLNASSSKADRISDTIQASSQQHGGSGLVLC